MEKTVRKKFNKDRFDVIPEAKRKQVLAGVIHEFAEKGFNGTSINKVAKKAGISIGAMYSYFDSKEDLFLTVVERLFDVLELAIKDADRDRDFYEVLEELFYRAHDYATDYAEMNQIYLDFSTHSLAALSKKVSVRLESISRDFYVELIERAKKNGQIDPATDTGMLSFMIDNFIMMYQFSFASDYYKDRMRLFIGDAMFEDKKGQVRAMMEIIRKMR